MNLFEFIAICGIILGLVLGFSAGIAKGAWAAIRFCEVLDDGSLASYMQYRPFGRWQPDKGELQLR